MNNALQLLMLCGLLGLSFTSVFAANSPAESSVINHIATAQKNLAATERRIDTERQQLARELSALEQEVVQLREKTSVARRLADEKTLSLSQLESRLDSWRQQQTYQQNLLHRFLQQHNLAQPQAAATASVSDQVKRVVESSRHFLQRFNPTWHQAAVVMPSGEMPTLPVLTIGPVHWYWNAASEQAGMASRQDSGILQSDLTLNTNDSAAIEHLLQNQAGEIVFDPTLTRALARQQQAESLYQHLVKGGLWAIPILLFALFALTIALFKVAQLWRLPKLIRFTPGAMDSLLQQTNTAITRQVHGMQKGLLDIAVGNASPRQRDDALFMRLQEDKHQLERWIGAIAITAAVSPLLGLLGTVSGMIETFKMMTLFGSGDPEVVSGGIAQALVTTELGLVVAIPALILNAALSRRAKSYYNELENFAILISKSGETQSDITTHGEHSGQLSVHTVNSTSQPAGAIA